MKHTLLSRLLIALTSFFLLSVTLTAHAQYVWLDSNNVKTYSDSPPPTSVPEDKILKTPNSRKARRNQKSPSELTQLKEEFKANRENENEKIALKKKEIAEKKAEEKKKKEALLKKENALKKKKVENCTRAKQQKKSLDSGMRIVQTDKNGKRSYMTDSERKKERKLVENVLRECQ